MARNQLPEVVFITYPGIGHLLPMVKIARSLIAQSHNQISAVIVILKPPLPDDKVNSYIQSMKSDGSHFDPDLTLLELPSLNFPPDQLSRYTSIAFAYMEAYKPVIEQTLTERYGVNSATKQQGGKVDVSCGGLVVDMFCTTLIDVADGLGVPSYVFFSSGTSLLLLLFYLGDNLLHTADVGGGFPNETVMNVPGFENPVPMEVWPQLLLQDKENRGKMILRDTSRFRRSKGIIVNTFMELETSIIQALQSSLTSENKSGPSIYPVGPILTITEDCNESVVEDNEEKNQIISWLDTQPPSSVVFLCFGSKGCFNVDQLKEIAAGLERSGQRFLWSLRRPTGDISNLTLPTSNEEHDEEDHFSQVLPEGFLDRTTEIGKVIFGWVPQVEVLSHKAIGAFMSHCGWNSIMESLWFGVPILAWPMYAEQQLNAFTVVKELGLAVEIRMDYRYDYRTGTANMVVSAEEIEKGIRRLMEDEEGKRVKQKVKDVSQMGKKALLETDGDGGGSSYNSMVCLLADVVRNSSCS